MIRVSELDDVLAEVVRCTAELVAQGVIHPGLEVGPAHLLATDADVGRKEVHMRIEVAHVERQRVLSGKLADGLDRFQAVDAGEQVGGGCSIGHGAAAQMKAMPPLTAMF